MFKLLRAIALLATLTMAAATAAAAGGDAMRASLVATASIVSPDTSSCPAGYDWLITIHDAGTGTMVGDAYSGDVTWVSDHCTRLLLDKRPGTLEGHSVGKVVGQQTIVTPDGVLYLDYQGTFINRGVFPTEYTTDGTMSYTITGGTGIFAGASGGGHMDVFDQPPPGLRVEMNGALQLHD